MPADPPLQSDGLPLLPTTRRNAAPQSDNAPAVGARLESPSPRSRRAHTLASRPREWREIDSLATRRRIDKLVFASSFEGQCPLELRFLSRPHDRVP